MRGIDTDNYDGAIPVSHFKMLHDEHDVRFNIIGLEAGMPFAKLQRENSNAAGIETPISYRFLYWDDRDLERMKQAASFGQPVAIDCEYGTGMPGGPSATEDRIWTARDVLKAEGMYWGIYTGQWWWPGNTRNSQAFKDDPLWVAAYPFGAQKLPPKDWIVTEFGVTFGGWTEATIWQYADVCYGDDLGPWALDLNAWNPAKLPRKDGPMQPTKEQALDALIKAGAIIIAGDRSLEELSPTDIAALDWITTTAKGPRA